MTRKHGKPVPQDDDGTASGLEASVLWHIRNLTTLPLPETQYRLPGKRQYRYDFAWKNKKLLLEVQGGIYTKGAHARAGGIIRDNRKANYAAAQGWRVMYFNSAFPDNPHGDLAMLVAAWEWTPDTE